MPKSNQLACPLSLSNIELTIYEELTPVEVERLAELEEKVDMAIRSIFDAGAALTEIAKSQLFRHRATEWKQYLRDRWNISPPHAYKLMNAYQVSLTFKGEAVKPVTLDQATALYGLRKLGEEKVKRVFKEAVKAKESPNSGDIKRVAAKLDTPPLKLKKNQWADYQPAVQSVFRRKTVLAIARKIKAVIEDIEGVDPRVAGWLDERDLWIDAISQVMSELLDQEPHCECIECHGMKPDCEVCRGTGYLTKGAHRELMG